MEPHSCFVQKQSKVSQRRSVSDNDADVIKTKMSVAGHTPAVPLNDPEVVEFFAATAALDQAESDIRTAEQTVAQRVRERDTSLERFRTAKSRLASSVEKATNGDADAIVAEGFALASEAQPRGELGELSGFSATTTNVRGAIDLAWDSQRAHGAFNYELRYRKASEPAGAAKATFTSRSRHRVMDLESGVEYVFEGRAHGSNNRVGPWSAPVSRFARLRLCAALRRRSRRITLGRS